MQLNIRHIEPQDGPAVHTMLISPHVIAGTMRLPYESPAYAAKRIEPSEGAIKLVASFDEAVVGYIELIADPHTVRHRHAAELNMLIVHADWQGKGVARALMRAILDLADNWLQLNRVSLIVWCSKRGAIELYKKNGFLLEGTMRKYVFRQGTYEDAYLMARLKD